MVIGGEGGETIGCIEGIIIARKRTRTVGW
jgi:hypothetical protein